jgi:hypothetical protein
MFKLSTQPLRCHFSVIFIVTLTVILVHYGPGGLTIQDSTSIEEQHHDENKNSTHLHLPTFWDSHMVLQREPAVSNIWGWAAPGANISVTIDRRTITSTYATTVAFSIASNESGIWSVDIPPQRAGSGYSIHITDASKMLRLEMSTCVRDNRIWK